MKDASRGTVWRGNCREIVTNILQLERGETVRRGSSLEIIANILKFERGETVRRGNCLEIIANIFQLEHEETVQRMLSQAKPCMFNMSMAQALVYISGPSTIGQ